VISTYFTTGINEKIGPKMIRNNFGSSFYLNIVKDLQPAMSGATKRKKLDEIKYSE
jgi:hypothetical protein